MATARKLIRRHSRKDPVIRVAIVPRDARWRLAAPGLRREYLQVLGRLAAHYYDEQLAAGIDRHGKPLDKVKLKFRPRYRSGRPLDGPPLTPHQALSRTRRWLYWAIDGASIVLGWKNHWGQILEYHAAGELHNDKLPVRDVLGIAPAYLRRIEAAALRWWETGELPKGMERQLLLPSFTRGSSIALPTDAGSTPPRLEGSAGRRITGRIANPVAVTGTHGAPTPSPAARVTEWGRVGPKPGRRYR